MTLEIVFSAGCFWGVEKHFSLLSGVLEANSGYVGGNYDNPTYDDVLRYRLNIDDKIINHTEAVQVKFDSEIISNMELIKTFWEMHDPTQEDGQGNDIGNNYRSAIFYTTKEQKEIIDSTKIKYQDLLYKEKYGEIVTEIKKLDKFYLAEDYHQNYLDKNPNGYCPNHRTGVKFSD